jgi:hypothetical protein
MTNRTPKPKTSAAVKKEAKKASASKRYLMPQVDLGGLGGGDDHDDLPPLDLGRFGQGEKAKDADTQQPATPTRQEMPTSPTAQPVDEAKRSLEGDTAPARASTAAQPIASEGTQGTHTPPQAAELDRPAVPTPSAEETAVPSSPVPSPAPAPDSLTRAAAQSTAPKSASGRDHEPDAVVTRPQAGAQATPVDSSQTVPSEPQHRHDGYTQR